MSSPIASKHAAFPLIEASASEVPAFLKRFVLKEANSETYFETVLAAMTCLCDVIPFDSKLAGRKKDL